MTAKKNHLVLKYRYMPTITMIFQINPIKQKKTRCKYKIKQKTVSLFTGAIFMHQKNNSNENGYTTI